MSFSLFPGNKNLPQSCPCPPLRYSSQEQNSLPAFAMPPASVLFSKSKIQYVQRYALLAALLAKPIIEQTMSSNSAARTEIPFSSRMCPPLVPSKNEMSFVACSPLLAENPRNIIHVPPTF